MSLPAPWVDRIFDKLTLVYGRDFASRWEGMNICDVKTDWGHELDGLEANPKAIAYALQNLPAERPPTVLQFRAIAHKCPSENQDLIALPRASAERIAAELLRMGGLRERPPQADSKEWARRIIKRHDSGDRITPYSLKCARDALGLTVEREAA
jgi:hypothetical protein